MAKIYLLVAGVMLCSIPDCPLDNKLFIHLRQMKTIPSQSCLEHRHDFRFSWRKENITPTQISQGTSYHQRMLQQISASSPQRAAVLLGTAPSSTNYSSLNESLEQLEEVLLDCPHLGIAVRKYFQGIHLYLKGKEYSPCAWEDVRVKIEKCLSLM